MIFALRFRRAILCLCFSILTLLPATVHASASAVPETQSAQGSDQDQNQKITKQDLEGLVETLENPDERERFIKNLNALIASDQELEGGNINADSAEDESASPPSLSEALGLENHTEEISDNFESFLDEHNLNSSYVGKFLSTLGTFFVFWIFCLVALKVSRSLRDYVLPIAERYYINAQRIRLYNRMLRYFFYFLIALVVLYFNGVIWGLSEFGFLENTYLIGIISNLFSILLITLVAVTAWEAMSGFIEYAMQKVTGRYSKRLHTLLPIVRNVLFFVFSIMFTLVLLSQLGIDIMPLLAGAGVVGIAVGFGAQTMVKDFLTGFIIIMEDLIQVGDVAGVGGKTGLIERITIRKVQLRDLDGTVYTVPFSQINVVSNLTKDFSYYLLDVGIAYREDTDQVVKYLREIDEEMRSEENFQNLILEPIDILGVDQFGDSAVVIKARIKTLPIKQWEVGREFNRRMKYKFDKHGIEIPFPHQTVYFGEDKDGSAPPAYVQIEDAHEDQKAIEGPKKKTDSKPAKPRSAKATGKTDSPKKKKSRNPEIESSNDADNT